MVECTPEGDKVGLVEVAFIVVYSGMEKKQLFCAEELVTHSPVED